MRAAGAAGRVLYGLARLVLGLMLGLVVVASIGAGALAWRLSQGPIVLPWLAHRIEAAANAGQQPIHLAIGRAALAWEGFSDGAGTPLDLRLSDVVATDQTGRTIARVPQAAVGFAVAPLLIGRIEPNDLEADGARLTVTRSAAGAIGVPGGVSDPAGRGGRLRLDAWQRVRIRDAALTVIDHGIGAPWQVMHATIDLDRSAGGVTGRAGATLALGGISTRLSAQAARTADGSTLTARLAPVSPAALARAAPGLAALAALDAPVSGSTTLQLDRALRLRHLRVALQIGGGQAQIGTGSVGFLNASLVAEGPPQAISLDHAEVVLAAPDGGPGPTLQAHGSLDRGKSKITARLAVDFGPVAFADLAYYWPVGVGGDARPWITQNITAGTATGGQVAVTLTGPTDLSAVSLAAASGTIRGSGLTVHWLRPMAPITAGVATVTIVGPDEIDIATQSGRDGALLISDGMVRVTRLQARDQIGDIATTITGPLVAAIDLLKQPRLRLLSRHKLPLEKASGQAVTHLTLRLPLRNDVTIDQVAIHASSTLTGVHLGGIVDGRDVDRGTLKLEAGNDGLSATGEATLAGIATRVSVALDFRAGPPAQVVTRADVSGTATPVQLRAAGISTGGLLAGGSAAVRVRYAEQRDAAASIDIAGDFARAALAAPIVAWNKPAGAPATASVRILLQGARLVGMSGLQATGPGLSINGSGTFARGRPELLTLTRAVIGRSDATGTVVFPAAAGQPIAIALHGPLLDLSSTLPQHARTSVADQPVAHVQPWTLDARFAHVDLTRNLGFSAVVLTASSANGLIRTAQLASGPPESVHGRIAPAGPGARSLVLTAADAGGLLRDLDITDELRGGAFSLTGRFDDSLPREPLSGTAEITGSHIINAPIVAKVLQGLSIYGLGAALRGPGMAVTRAEAPFRLDGSQLTVMNARAFNPSLGGTIQGSVDLGRNTADLRGTIVPAYAINSVLGGIPVIGKLFSPERGGGVFAATYSVRGSLRNPTVRVNPLAALTPGFLRGVFDIFQK
ncbi:MAG TPA: AsmA-like C-terminal region-containing protein [Acetobacteraceae bacterium]|nr:AsmA-like C-terminal region-containing protein [Acetobacteraceae bacterium]